MATMKIIGILGIVLVILGVANAHVKHAHHSGDPLVHTKYDRRGLGQQMSGGGGGSVFDISKLGGKGDGNFDNTEVLTKAWNDACQASGAATILIPSGTFLAGLLDFKGPCTANPVTIQLQGTLKAKPDAAAYPQGVQIQFYQVTFQIMGGGTIDANGQAEQAQKIKAGGGKNLPDSLTAYQCINSGIKGIKMVNAKGFNIKVVESDNFKIDGVGITCGGDTLNTDGIHIARCKGASITNCNIAVGDDCISMGDAMEDFTVRNIQCGPGHGISIGSLGRFQDEKDVRNVEISNVTLTSTMYGARIKTWHNSPVLTVSNITFKDFTFKDCGFPIIIDQHYNMGSATIQSGVSKVKVNGVTFKNFKGTTTANLAVSLNCSSAAPCEGVKVQDVALTYSGTNTVDKVLHTTCEHAKAVFSGTTLPPCK